MAELITDEQLVEIGERAERCKVVPDHPGSLFSWQDSAKDVPALLAEVRQLRAGEVEPPSWRHPAAYSPGEWIHQWNRLSPEERHATVVRIYTASRYMGTCITEHHEERLATIAAERDAARAEAEQLRAQMATVQVFLGRRAEFVTAINNCPADNSDDYQRWQGHAEARRVLATDLGLPVAWPDDHNPTEAADAG